MIYSNVEVPMPLKKRVTKYGGHGKNYVYEIVKRKGKETPKDVVVCIGIAIDEERLNPNEKYFDLHPEYIKKIPTVENKVFDTQMHIGTSMLLREISKRIGLYETLKESFSGYEEIIQTLLEYYMLERESVSQLYKYYLYNHYTELNYIPSEKKLSVLFNEYLTYESIAKFLQKWMEKQLSKVKDGTIEIDFDSTNFNIGSKSIESAERGKPKEEEGLPQINVAYFLDRKSGLPIYYDIYYGSIIDMEHCKNAVDKIHSVKSNIKCSFVMDRGYFSKSNLEYMTTQGYDFLCMGKDGIRLDKLIEGNPIQEITRAQNRIYAGIYGIKNYGKAFETDDKDYHIYLYYNNSKVVEDLPKLQDYLEYYSKALIGKRDKRYGIRNTYGKMIELIVDENDVIVSATPNYDYLNHYRDTCGYFWIVSNEDLTIEEALSCYRHRDSIEKVFRGIKTDSDLNKVYASSDEAFEAKSFLAFLTAILRADISMQLKPFFFQYSSETTQTVLKELEKIKAELIGKKYLLRYPLTSKQKQILSFYELDASSVSSLVKNLNLSLSFVDE